jgi:hypothetical protein
MLPSFLGSFSDKRLGARAMPGMPRGAKRQRLISASSRLKHQSDCALRFGRVSAEIKRRAPFLANLSGAYDQDSSLLVSSCFDLWYYVVKTNVNKYDLILMGIFYHAADCAR